MDKSEHSDFTIVVISIVDDGSAHQTKLITTQLSIKL